MDFRLIKETIDATDIYVKEFGELCGVSRVTVHSWMSGERIDELRVPRVEAVIEALTASVAAKELPFLRPYRVASRDITMLRLQEIVLKHLKLRNRAG